MTRKQVEDLVDRYAKGIATEEEIQQLTDWYHNQPVGLVRWPASETGEEEKVYGRIFRRVTDQVWPARENFRRLRWVGAAAIILFCLAMASVILYLQPFSKAYIALNNPAGKLLRVVLPDSSQVWLNASSQLYYAKDFNKSRKVRLTGEGYFQVTPDKAHPFTVDAGQLRTTVLGTSFTVSAYAAEKELTVTVISGRVLVFGDLKTKAVLTPSMQLKLNKTNQTVLQSSIDTTAILAWTKGKLQFRGETLEEIARKLEYWYGLKIVFDRQGMGNCRYYMSFSNTLSPEELFSAMSAVTEMKYSINQLTRTVTLSGRECP